MANQLYASAREGFLKGEYHWEIDSFSIILVDARYVFSTNHSTYGEVESFSRATAPMPVENKNSSNGYASGDGVTFSGVSWPLPITQAILFKQLTNLDQSPLIAYYDVVDGLPLENADGDYNLFADALFGGYFRI